MMMMIIIIIIINFIKIIIVIIIIILDKIWAFPSRAGEPKYLYEKLSPLTWLPFLPRQDNSTFRDEFDIFLKMFSWGFQRNKWEASPVRATRGGGDIIMVIRDHVNSLHTVQIKKRNMCIFFLFCLSLTHDSLTRGGRGKNLEFNTSMKVWKELFKLSNHPKGQNLTQIIFLIHVQNHLTNS